MQTNHLDPRPPLVLGSLGLLAALALLLPPPPSAYAQAASPEPASEAEEPATLERGVYGPAALPAQFRVAAADEGWKRFVYVQTPRGTLEVDVDGASASPGVDAAGGIRLLFDASAGSPLVTVSGKGDVGGAIIVVGDVEDGLSTRLPSEAPRSWSFDQIGVFADWCATFDSKLANLTDSPERMLYTFEGTERGVAMSWLGEGGCTVEGDNSLKCVWVPEPLPKGALALHNRLLGRCRSLSRPMTKEGRTSRVSLDTKGTVTLSAEKGKGLVLRLEPWDG